MGLKTPSPWEIRSTCFNFLPFFFSRLAVLLLLLISFCFISSFLLNSYFASLSPVCYLKLLYLSLSYSFTMLKIEKVISSALIVEGEANQFKGSLDPFMGLIHFCEHRVSGTSQQKFFKSFFMLACSLLRVKELIQFSLYKS